MPSANQPHRNAVAAMADHLIYFADFGLALSSGFELSAAEEQFLSDHLTYDRYYTASRLIRYHLADRLGSGRFPAGVDRGPTAR